MNYILKAIAVFFLVLMVCRIVEMSVAFDWVDVLWSGIFLTISLCFGAASQVKSNA